MKRWLTHSLVVLAIVIASCDFGPINNAVDDFAIVVGLEEINTGVSFVIYDKDTGDLITSNVTIDFAEGTAANTIDIFSDPVDEIEFGGGFINIGIRNEIVPTETEPFEINMTVRAEGYLEKSMNVSVTSIGLTSLDVELFSENNPPESIITYTVEAPRDSLGNPMDFPIPFDSTTGGLHPFYEGTLSKALNANTGNSLVLPLIIKGQGESEVIWPTDQFNSGWQGNPYAIQISIRVWSKKGEENTVSNLWGESCSFCNFDQIKGMPFFTRYTSFMRLLEIKIQKEENGPFEKVRQFQPVGTSSFEQSPILIMAYTTPQFSDADSLYTQFQQSTSGMYSGTYHPPFVTAPHSVIHENARYSGRLSFLNFLLTSSTLSENGPVTHSLFIDENNPDELMRKFLVTQLHGYYSRATISFPAYGVAFGIHGEMKTGSVTFEANGYGVQDTMEVILQSGGVSMKFEEISDDGESITIPNVPLSYSHIIVKTPDGESGPFRPNLINYDGRTINLQVDPKDSGKITSTITTTLTCASSTESVRVNNIPTGAASIYFRETNTTDKYKEADISSWDYDSNSKELKGVTVKFNGVRIGTEYDVKLTFGEETETETFTIEGENFSKIIEAPNNFCSE